MGLSETLYTAVLTSFLTLFVVALICFFVPRCVLASDFQLSSLKIDVFFFIGLIPIILGLITIMGFVRGSILHGTGSPVPYDMPKELIVRGSYRVVRNPMYFGCCLILFGQALLFKSFGFLLYLLVYFLALSHACRVH